MVCTKNSHKLLFRPLRSPGSYDGIPESDHHIIAARGEDPDLLSQVEAPYSPGQLEDVAVQLVGDVHDDDGALGVPGAGHHRLVVREILDTIDPVTVETLTWSHLTPHTVALIPC